MKIANAPRMKCTALIKHVITRVKSSEITGALESFMFLVLICQWTDFGLEKIICVIALFPSERQWKAQLLELNTVPGTIFHTRSSEPQWLHQEAIPMGNKADLPRNSVHAMVHIGNTFHCSLSVLSWGDHCSQQSVQSKPFELQFQECCWGQYFWSSVKGKTMTCSSEMWKTGIFVAEKKKKPVKS